MAISIYKQANSQNFVTTPVYPHANTGKENITFGSTLFNTYLDFAYAIKLEDYKSGNDYYNSVPPLSSSGYSFYNVINNISHNVKFKACQELTSFSADTEHLGKYNFNVAEYYNGAEYATTNIAGIYANQSLKPWLNNAVYDVDMLEYSLNDTDSKFLVDVESTNVQGVKMGDWGTWKSLYGGIQVILGNRSYFNKLQIQVTKSNGTKYNYELDNNVSWVNITDASEHDAGNNTVDFPVMPQNLSQGTFALTSIQLESGYVYYPGTTGGVDLEPGDEYRINAYSTTSPYVDERVSQYYYFKVECDNSSDMQVSWENELGGVEYYNFSNLESVTISNKTKTYTKNREAWTDYAGAMAGFDFYYEQTEARRDVVYQSTYREIYSLTSRLLAAQEVDRLKSLFYSKSIEIRIDGKWHPALPNKATMKLINSKRQGLKYYKFDILVDTNKNLI